MIGQPASNSDVAATDFNGAASRTRSSVLQMSRWRKYANFLISVSWAVNTALLVAAFGWVFFFGESRESIELMLRAVLPAWSTSTVVIRDPSRLGMGVSVGLVAIAFVLATCLLMLASLFLGHGQLRTTRTWLIFTAIVCGWLGLAVGWPAVYWSGQQRRLAAILPAAGTVVGSLREHWPTSDSDSPELGPFLAYPISMPTALLPLRSVTFPKTDIPFSAVERTGDEAVRFELSGAEAGAWLEWRRKNTRPQSFVGGLDTKYSLAEFAQLAPEWFLVRYRAAGLAD